MNPRLLPFAACIVAAAITGSAVAPIVSSLAVDSGETAIITAAYADTHSNPHLLVSAENPESENHFAGSMVIEVIVTDPVLADTDSGEGEPYVSVNGATLRMVQAGNGYWYGYFANLDAAQYADQISRNAGSPGQGLDFGVFCHSSTPESVLGVSFSDSQGVAVPRSGGLAGFTDGTAPLSACSSTSGGGIDPSSPEINNVVRSPPSINRNTNVETGQIGLDRNAWPVIQLFSFSGDVRIQYEPGGRPQQVILQYDDEIPSIRHTTDRNLERYPAGAAVLLYVNDPRLNQDPTDEDSWTFGTTPGSPSVFYQAFRDGGRTAANGGLGLANLYGHLNKLGFDDNGYLEIENNGVLDMRTNRNQPADYVHDGRGNLYADIITLVESRPNSGLFESIDSSGTSSLYVGSGAARGTSATISYNDRSLSLLTGSHTAQFSLDCPSMVIPAQDWRSGTRVPVTLQDQDQNIDPRMRDNLDVFRDSAIVPALKIGSPLTASGASDVRFYPVSGSFERYVQVPSHVPDKTSARLHLDPGDSRIDPGTTYEMISVDMGFSASGLYDLLMDVSARSTYGTNWLNVDLRSLMLNLETAGIEDASVDLYFGGLSDTRPVTVVDRLGSAQNLIRIPDDAVRLISAKSGTVHLVIDFGPGRGIAPNDRAAPVPSPIVMDFFSFGVNGRNAENNAMYRLELEETSRDTGVFTGTLEFAAANQLNVDDPGFVRNITPIGNNVKFITLDRMVDEERITITYSDLAKVGVVVPKSISSPETEIRTQSGTVTISTPSGNLRFGTPITITLDDPDLNRSADTIEVYRTVDDPRLPSVDTVGSGPYTMLEVKFKDIRYKRCVIDGVSHGGLASTGFALAETGPGTGVFEGVFKMPTWICNKSGTELISTAGGSMDVVYRDSRDSSGNSGTTSMLRQQNSPSEAGVEGKGGGLVTPQAGHTGSILKSPADNDVDTGTGTVTNPEDTRQTAGLSTERVVLGEGDTGKVILSGDVGVYVPGLTLSVVLTHPGGTSQEFDLHVGADGRYGALLTFEDGKDPRGLYAVSVLYGGIDVVPDGDGPLLFHVESESLVIPRNVKEIALEWSAGVAGDAEFSDVLLRLAKMGVIAHEGLLPAADPESLPGESAGVVAGGDGDDAARDMAAATADATSSPEPAMIFPPWLENVAGWWAVGSVSDEAFVASVQYMLDEGILVVHTE